MGGGRRGLGWAELFEQGVDGQHDEEVDSAGDEEEGDDGVEEIAVFDFAAVHGKDER